MSVAPQKPSHNDNKTTSQVKHQEATKLSSPNKTNGLESKINNINSQKQKQITNGTDPKITISAPPRPKKSGNSSINMKFDPAGKTSVTATASDSLVKLIAVGIKEASVDTPTFRAFINHADSQIRLYDQWLRNLLPFFRAYYRLSYDLSQFNENTPSTLLPNFLQEGMLNPDYALSTLDNTVTGMSKFMEEASNCIKFKLQSLKVIEIVITKDIPEYFDLKRNFEKIQEKYDSYLFKFVSQPKTKDPFSIKEDAFQLFEIRKQYCSISLDLHLLITKFESRLSVAIMELCDSIWSSNMNPQKENLLNFFKIGQFYRNAKRGIACGTVQAQTFKPLFKDLLSARKHSEEAAIELFTPSTDLINYTITSINVTDLFADTKDSATEKHGWVFMKSRLLLPVNNGNNSGNNGKETVWVRRWLFIKEGVFGLLSLSPNGKFVQESDKIGVLLCNVRYAPEEDRRFTFEIKTYQTSIVLQAETLTELKSWLNIFKRMKLSALSLQEQNIESIATGRYSPMLEQLAMTPIVAKDVELVTLNKENEEISGYIEDIYAKRYLSKRTGGIQIESDKFFDSPIYTQVTNLSCVARSFLTPTIIPNAITSNVWGFVNWGLYYILDGVTQPNISVDLQRWLLHPNSNNNNNNNNIQGQSNNNLGQGRNSFPRFFSPYPEGYSGSLELADSKMKATFESAISPNEFTVLRFRCAWCPNAKQELLCHVYVTQHKMYIYTNNCGLISLALVQLVNFLNAEIIEKEEFDILKIYSVAGISIKFKIYLGSSKIIRDQLNFLIRNITSQKPFGLSEIFKELNKIKVILEKDENSKVIDNTKLDPRLQNPSLLTVANNSAYSNTKMKLNYADSMNLCWMSKYDVSAKALFHILVGDQSFLLQSILPLADSSDVFLKHTTWRCNSRQQLIRNVWSNGPQGLAVEQFIDQMVNNKYYSIKETTQTLHFRIAGATKLEIRFLIFAADSKSSKLMVYYKLTSQIPFLAVFVRFFFHQVMALKVDVLNKKLLESIQKVDNDRRKTVGAIKLFGSITKYNSDVPAKEEKLFSSESRNINYSLLCDYLIKSLSLKLNQIFFESYRFLTKFLITIIKSLQSKFILYLIIIISISFNIFLSGKTTWTYWAEIRTEKKLDEYVKPNGGVMHRAIFLKNVKDLINETTDLSYDSKNSLCFNRFKQNSKVLNIDDWIRKGVNRDDEDEDDDISNLNNKKNDITGNIIRQTFLEFGIKRNELLVELDILNKAEESYALAEWKNWVLNENKKCQIAQDVIINKDGNKSDGNSSSILELSNEYSELMEYCNSAELELRNIHLSLL
ncbi:hypothetical protein B5S28_g4393 [[Candida] boidinii]|nr:hypothetical protein B5S28_g4393 [[Candida] boidinii]